MTAGLRDKQVERSKRIELILRIMQMRSGGLRSMKRALTAMALLAMLAATAHGAERAELRNGFTMRCDHHAEVDGHVRIYLTPGDDDYMDLSPDAIAGFVETRESAGGGAQARPVRKDAKLNSRDLGEMLNRAGKAHNLDVDLLASVVKAESNGNAHAVSRAGARGLMQLMPATAEKMGVANSLNPGENVQGGSAYLDQMLRRYHENLALALAAYNAGPEAVDRYHGIPPYAETQAYVARVIHEFNRRVRARERKTRRAAKALPTALR